MDGGDPPKERSEGSHVCHFEQCPNGRQLHSAIVCSAVWMPIDGYYFCGPACVAAHNQQVRSGATMRSADEPAAGFPLRRRPDPVRQDEPYQAPFVAQERERAAERGRLFGFANLRDRPPAEDRSAHIPLGTPGETAGSVFSFSSMHSSPRCQPGSQPASAPIGSRTPAAQAAQQAASLSVAPSAAFATSSATSSTSPSPAAATPAAPNAAPSSASAASAAFAPAATPTPHKRILTHMTADVQCLMEAIPVAAVVL